MIPETERSAAGGPITAIIPLKALDRAKGRMAGEFDGSTRRALVTWMFGRVLAACREASLVGAVLVVAGDHAAAEVAGQPDVDVLVEPRPGLARALLTADAAAAGAPATLVVAADLPLARGADLDRVCAAGVGEHHAGGDDDRRVVVAPTRDGGTGALYRRPPRVIATRYGPGSAAAHLRLAAAAGITALLEPVPALALDVDTASQLREAAGLDREVAAWTTAARSRLLCGPPTPPEI